MNAEDRALFAFASNFNPLQTQPVTELPCDRDPHAPDAAIPPIMSAKNDKGNTQWNNIPWAVPDPPKHPSWSSKIHLDGPDLSSPRKQSCVSPRRKSSLVRPVVLYVEPNVYPIFIASRRPSTPSSLKIHIDGDPARRKSKLALPPPAPPRRKSVVKVKSALKEPCTPKRRVSFSPNTSVIAIAPTSKWRAPDWPEEWCERRRGRLCRVRRRRPSR